GDREPQPDGGRGRDRDRRRPGGGTARPRRRDPRTARSRDEPQRPRAPHHQHRMTDAAEPRLPSWAQVGEKRRGHVARVTALLDRWAAEMSLTAGEAQAWHDAGRWHDALRDAPEADLRELLRGTPFAASPSGVLHGPAAAARLEREGEARAGVLLAVRWHTVGNA